MTSMWKHSQHTNLILLFSSTVHLCFWMRKGGICFEKRIYAVLTIDFYMTQKSCCKYLTNTILVQESPRHVLYPRRIYELQAEEGCYSSLPSMKTPEIQDDVVVLKKSTPSSKRKNFKQLVRKLTTNSMPTNSSDNYTPSNSPKFSTCSETWFHTRFFESN